MRKMFVVLALLLTAASASALPGLSLKGSNLGYATFSEKPCGGC